MVAGLIFLAAACNKTADQNPNPPPPPQANQPSPQPSPQPTPQPQPAPQPPPPPPSGPVEISMTDSGFSPATLTVKKGSTVVFKNNSTKARWPASAPHPTHTDYPGFDPKGPLAAGESWSFKFDQVGIWKYHDHLQPTLFGSVTVTE